MTKELAKTITTALVQFIDEQRPEGTMCCSNAECESIEQMLEGEHFDIIEAFIQKKLTRLTEFEQEVSDIVEYCKEHGENVAFDYAKRHAKTLLALAREQFKPEIDAELEKAYKTQDNVVFRKGWEQGRADALNDLPRWRRWENGACGNSHGHPIALISGAGGIRFSSALGITGEKYIMLDDLKKLPGFKEER